jgi:hypothetical protein
MRSSWTDIEFPKKMPALVRVGRPKLLRRREHYMKTLGKASPSKEVRALLVSLVTARFYPIG